MRKKLLKNPIKIIEEYNKQTGSDNFYTYIQFAFAVLSLIEGVVLKSYKLFIWSFVFILSGIYFYFQPLILYRLPKIRILINILLFLGIPIGSFFIGVSFCKTFFEQVTDKMQIIMYASFAIVTAVLFCSLYFKDAIEHIIKLGEDKSYIFFLLLEIYQIIHFFAIIFSVIFIFDHNGFVGVNISNAFTIYLDMFYFSTITFTTLGYGDIVPINPLAKVTVIIEVFLFVIVISLVVVNLAKGRGTKEAVTESVTEEKQVEDKSIS